MSDKPHDVGCAGPLCIRNITKTHKSRDWRFTVEWRTSTGIVKTDGWRWLVMHNRIVAPMCGGHHIFRLTLNTRAAIRNLLTRVMLDTRNVTVPIVGRKRVKKDENRPETRSLQ